MYFKHSAIQFPEDPDEIDENLIEGENWEFKEPEKVEAWGLMIIPNNNNFAFTYKFKNAQCFLNLSFLKKVKEKVQAKHPSKTQRNNPEAVADQGMPRNQ